MSRPQKRYFVSGTDTGVGKTFVACLLARRARERGAMVLAYKPIETGCTGQLGEDQQALVEAAGSWQTGDARGTYQFAMAAAPSVAAAAEHRQIELDRIKLVLETSQRGCDLVLVEGAGGLRVPISDAVDTAELAHFLRLPLLIVARSGLGTINHTLLTIEAAERSGLSVAAVIFSRRPDEDLALASSNRDEIQARWPGRLILLDSVEPARLDMLL